MCIGLAFALALVLGPFLGAKIGLSGLFWLTAASAIMAIVLLLLGVPKIVTHSARRDALPVWSEMSSLLRHPQLLRLDFGVLALHCTLTAWFVILPLELVSAGLPEEQHGWLYLPTLFGSFALMVPMLIVAAKKQQQKRFFQLAISLLIGALVISQLFNTHWWALVVGVLIFFVGFNFLEASLPSLLTKLAPPGSKGSASGVYTTSQFLGAFLGGAVGGWLQQHFGPQAVMLFCSGLLLCWLLATIGMRDPAQYRSVSFTTAVQGQQQAEQLAQQLSVIGGVVEARVVVADSATYLKVEKAHYDEPAVQAVIAR
ncbi:major facilitator superfamily permease, partial [Idiomarina xiamenensis 10-D-4]